jgi:hypothetical protein
MAAAKPEIYFFIVFLRKTNAVHLLLGYKIHFTDRIHVFGVGELNGAIGGSLSHILKPETINSRWRLPKPDVPVSQLLYKIAKKFQLLSACFWGQETQWRYRESSILKPDVRNSRWRLSNRKYLYFSFYSKEIPEANPVFLGSGNSVALLVMLYLETGSHICKMVAAKPEVRVSQLLYKIATNFQRLSACFRG